MVEAVIAARPLQPPPPPAAATRRFASELAELIAAGVAESRSPQIIARQLMSCIARGDQDGLSAPRAVLRYGQAELEHLRAMRDRMELSLAVNALNVPDEVLETMPVGLAMQYKVAPGALDGDLLTVLFSQAHPLSAVEEATIRRAVASGASRLGCEFVQAEAATITAVQTRMRMDGDLGTTAAETAALARQNYEQLMEAADRNSDRLRQVFSQAIAQGSSDIHFNTVEADDGSLDMTVRIRTLGSLAEIARWPFQEGIEILNRLRVASQMPLQQVVPVDASMPLLWPDVGRFDLRLASVPLDSGAMLVIRLLPQGVHQARSLSDLFPPLGGIDMMAPKLREAVRWSSGLVLVAGRTGDGKSTTLAALLGHLESPEVAILTIEDPVELRIRGAQQAATTIQMSFNLALRAYLRSDPDILMVGEIRDEETVETALRAAQTGHLLLSTVHARDAALTVRRVVDMGAPPSVLSEELRCVMSQRLVKRLCRLCSSGGSPAGCQSCTDGWEGRLAIAELMVVTPEMAEAIAEGRRGTVLRGLAGYIPFVRHAAAALRARETTPEQIERHFDRSTAREAVELAASGDPLDESPGLPR